MPNIVEIEPMHDKLKAFFAQPVVNAAPLSDEIQALICDVQSGKGLPAKLVARLEENARSMASDMGQPNSRMQIERLTVNGANVKRTITEKA